VKDITGDSIELLNALNEQPSEVLKAQAKQYLKQSITLISTELDREVSNYLLIFETAASMYYQLLFATLMIASEEDAKRLITEVIFTTTDCIDQTNNLKLEIQRLKEARKNGN
jgi:hypothetical protein